MNPKIEKMFTYHPPQPGQPEKYQQLRDKAKELAYLIDELCPSPREQALALTNLQQSTMWANAGIAMEGAEEPEGDGTSARDIVRSFGLDMESKVQSPRPPIGD